MDPSAQLDRGLEAMGLPLEPARRATLLHYLTLLGRWNRAYNLTAVRAPRDMVTRHLLDSLTLLPHLGGATVLDVGTGAGLPGLVLAVARPELAVTLLDANGKKVRFCRQAAAELGLANVAIEQVRVEDYVPPTGFDVVVSRAFTDLEDFAGRCLRLVAPGGRLLAMMGRGAPGAAMPRGTVLRRVAVPGLAEARHIAVVAKA